MLKLVSLLSSILVLSCSDGEIKEYSARVNNLGKANLKPLIVITDGPGMNFNYIAKHLTGISEKRNLILYDQLNCYHRKCAEKPIELSDLIKQLKNVSQQYGNNFGVIAHGWGTLLLMEFLTKTPKDDHPNEVILITPTPLKWSQMVQASQNNAEKYSKEDVETLANINNPRQCLKAINIAVKYALYNKNNAEKLNFDRYDCMLAEYIMGKMTNYNYESLTYLLPEKTLWITGESDFYKLPITHHRKAVISKSGHYPFAENNSEFTMVVNNFLG